MQRLSFSNIWNSLPNLMTKMILVMAMCSLVVLGSVILMNSSLGQNTINAQLKAKAVGLGNVIVAVAPSLILERKHAVLNELMESVSKDSDVVYAIIFSMNKMNISQYLNNSDSYIAQSIKLKGKHDFNGIVQFVDNQEGMITKEFSIINKGAKIAVLRLALNNSRLIQQKRSVLLKQLLLAVGMILFLSICLAALIYFGIKKPLVRLRQNIANLQRGEIAVAINVPNRDEIGQLTNVIDDWRQTIEAKRVENESTIKHLRKANTTLEMRIRHEPKSMWETNKRAEYFSLHDVVTGLPKQMLFLDRLQQAVLNANRENQQLAILVIEADRDTKQDHDVYFDHDLVLNEISERVARSLRKTDTIARMSYEKLAVVLTDSDVEKTLVVTQKIVRSFTTPVVFDNSYMHLRVNVGIALFPENGHDATTLLQHANIALFSARENPSAFAIYEVDENSEEIEWQRFNDELRNSVAEKKLGLQFHPQFDLQNGRVVSMVSSVYLKRSDKSILQQDELITMAEQLGLTDEISLWVIVEAIKKCAVWYKNGLTVNVAVSLFASNLFDLQFPAQIKHLLNEYGIKPDCLTIEIKEQALMYDPMQSLRVISVLHEIGVRLAIDDFGTGYTSMVYLKKLPIDELKIDGSLVHILDEDKKNSAITRSIINLSKNLGLIVTAKGVDSQNEWNEVKKFGCNFAVGNYISGPILEDQVEKWMSLPPKILQTISEN